MRRVEVPEPEVTVISQADFQEDLKRGYCVIEFNPERIEEIRDHVHGTRMTRKLEADLSLRCMRCEFDTLAGYVTERDGKPVFGTEIIEAHLEQGTHKWPYGPFKNPYGSTKFVQIEGVEGLYADYIKEQ